MLKPLADIQFPDLINFDRESNVTELIERIKQNKEWSEIYDGEEFQNASQMILQLFSYLTEKTAIKANRLIKENFISYAKSETAIVQNLRNKNVEIVQNTESEVELTGVILNGFINKSFILNAISLNGISKNSETIPFEIIAKKDGEYDYLTGVSVPVSEVSKDFFKVTAYSGTTHRDEFELTSSTLEQFKIQINHSNVIKDSVQVYFMTKFGEYIKLERTTTFAKEPQYVGSIFDEGKPYYILNYDLNGNFEIAFGSELFGGCFKQKHIDDYEGKIIIFSRSGGGAKANISKNKINQTVVVEYEPGYTFNINFFNQSPATGGSDKETLEEAKNYAPYRYGRDEAIVDKTDAKIMLSKIVNKHEVESPVMVEPGADTAPAWHAYHKIIPYRDWNDFVFPSVTNPNGINYTSSEYAAFLLAAIYDFANIKGHNFNKITNELVSYFIRDGKNYDLTYVLGNTNNLSDSLLIKAYDHNDKICDKIQFVGNYYKENQIGISKSQNGEHATFTTNAFKNITITDTNNNIRFIMDNNTFVFNINLSFGFYTYKEIAQQLQIAINTAITNSNVASTIFGEYVGGTFAYYIEETDNGRIVFQSPRYSEDSFITFLEPTNTYEQSQNIYEAFGIKTDYIYRAKEATGMVFTEEDCVLFPKTGDLFLKINKNFMNISYDFAKDDQTLQDINEEKGPIVITDIHDENLTNKGYPQLGTQLIIEAIKDNDVIDRLWFNGISDSIENTGFVQLRGEDLTFTNEDDDQVLSLPASADENDEYVFSKDANDKHILDYQNKQIQFSLVKGKRKTFYKQTYTPIARVIIEKLVYDGSSGFYIPSASATFDSPSIGSYIQNINTESGSQFTLNMPFDATKEAAADEQVGDQIKIKFYVADGFGNLVESLLIDFIYTDTITYNYTTPPADFESTPDIPLNFSWMVGMDLQNYDPLVSPNTYSYITFKAKDGEVDDSIEEYEAGYVDFDKFRLTFKNKNYNYIVCDYNPNPYQPTNEAKTIIDKLTDKSVRMIGIEHLIKPINVFPVGIELKILLEKNYSISEAYAKVKEIIFDNFSFNNGNIDHTINSGFGATTIQTTIGKYARDYGIVLVEPTIINVFDIPDDDTYLFVMDENMISRLRALESTNSLLVGLSNLFKVNIKIEVKKY